MRTPGSKKQYVHLSHLYKWIEL